MLSETPQICALTVVAPGVRFRGLAVLTTPAFCLANVLSWRTSSFVHSRRLVAAFPFFFVFIILVIFFVCLAMLAPIVEAAFYHISFNSQRRRVEPLSRRKNLHNELETLEGSWANLRWT